MVKEMTVCYNCTAIGEEDCIRIGWQFSSDKHCKVREQVCFSEVSLSRQVVQVSIKRGSMKLFGEVEFENKETGKKRMLLSL